MIRFAPLLALLSFACNDDAISGGSDLAEVVADTTDTAKADSPDATADTSAPGDTADASDGADTTVPTDTTAPTDTTTPSDTIDTADSEPAGPVLTLVVTVPPETPAGDRVYVSGNQPELGDWDGVGQPLTRRADGAWTIDLPFPMGTALAFKFTRGSWDSVEKSPSGAEIDDHTYTMWTDRDTITFAVGSWRDLVPVPPGPAGVEFIRGVSSQFLGPDRDIIIYLPPGYDTATARRYPVLYMHDGQNLMDPATSAFGTAWEIDDAATAAIDAGAIEPIIIVGIYNTADRIPEYTPVPDADYGGGNADNYGRFIIEELKPDIDATYRTQPEAGATGLCGSSLGGLVSMYLGLERPDVFTRIGVVSPSVWWADRDIVDRVDGLPGKLPLHIWLDIGTAEGDGETVDDTRLLRDALVTKGWVLGQDLLYGEYPGAAHNEAAWAARADDILEALYGL